RSPERSGRSDRAGRRGGPDSGLGRRSPGRLTPTSASTDWYRWAIAAESARTYRERSTNALVAGPRTPKVLEDAPTDDPSARALHRRLASLAGHGWSDTRRRASPIRGGG